jgi:hypothetical protein
VAQKEAACKKCENCFHCPIHDFLPWLECGFGRKRSALQAKNAKNANILFLSSYSWFSPAQGSVFWQNAIHIASKNCKK